MIYLSLGSNLGDREQNLVNAIRHLAGVGTIVRTSSFYETEPVDYTQQPSFVNCVVAIQTDLTPAQLLAEALQIELKMGRQRVPGRIKGPRLIDIDILLAEDQLVSTPELTVPHPAMHARRFVLEPLSEIAPNAVHPIFKRTIRQLREALPPGQEVRKLSPPPQP